MGSIIRILLLATLLVVAYYVMFRPRELRSFGRQARKIGYVYVVAILISAAVRLLFGWGT